MCKPMSNERFSFHQTIGETINMELDTRNFVPEAQSLQARERHD